MSEPVATTEPAQPTEPTWHWDEMAAMRAELADAVEIAATVEAALRAEVQRLEREKRELAASVSFWQEQAARAEERTTVATQALARALRTI